MAKTSIIYANQQEKALLEVTDKLYALCDTYGMDEENVREIRGHIDDVIREQTGMCPDCHYHVTRCKCQE